MSRRPSRFIKDMDMFGMPIPLHFDRKGSKHTTCCGFLATILFLVATVYVLREMVLGYEY
jgi:hypothetical protein